MYVGQSELETSGSREVRDRFVLHLFEIQSKGNIFIGIDYLSLLQRLSYIYLLRSFLVCIDNLEFLKSYALQNLGCNRTRTCDWPQINCNRSAGHTLHYCGHDKTFN